MNHSESIAKIAPAITAALAVMPNPAMNAHNPFFKNKYADLKCLTDAARGVLSDAGLAVVQTFASAPEGHLGLTTTLLHSSGEYISGTIIMPLDKKTPQAYGSAATYARRYSLAAICGMVGDPDDDAEGSMKRSDKPKASDTDKPITDSDI